MNECKCGMGISNLASSDSII